ncbi:bifunctional cobalt-precorrin-7 (C(5))-methyltransferase/cobalt-precorrin-6B (C(15))-methyltransferase [Butyrivibrio sp. AE3004]|uniref:bifunctional cobalt-precorrin-7 (C(5))-methyltransferase/cobalt-precorrin-6B (C(15))-methyltransferase n=1 Tax=Butyrivibrio sp. AE3004 TaxID=1506994 RepID=UPI000494C5C6|nr:bifunctional cobalt-precorrin-7 (C(5))-methyltransferase/cobalt-precorrin-6B (C(15))-methyltransferase [Butyrivibrio sp. AE3004]
MKSIVIFSGTTEGRVLSDFLAKDEIFHTVCVASDYGKEMMEENPYALIHVGRMDAGEMSDFLSDKEDNGLVIIDATHPYATEVTSNIKKAASKLSAEYIRVCREKDTDFSEDFCKYKTIEECAGVLDKTEGNVLLTTGSKELQKYCSGVSEEVRKRTYVRVLPSAESLKICEKEGIEPDHIIAMHGPFGRELNAALIKQYGIKHLITKESGAAGGFYEKKAAAKETGVMLHVIERPSGDNGISVEEAYCLVTGKKSFDIQDSLQIKEVSISGDEKDTKQIIYLIGMGMGTKDSMTLEALNALESSDAVFGAKRLVGNLSCKNKYEMYLSDEIIPVLQKEKINRAAIVFSGDLGFYSGAKKMTLALKNWRSDIDVRVIPGISSFSYLAARLGESYDDACFYSIHGKKQNENMQRLTDRVKHEKKTFVLLSGAGDISEIAKRLLDMGIDGRFVVGENLSYENERITELSFNEALSFKGNGIVCAFIYNDTPKKRQVLRIKRDADFIRGDVPMTKECIRHESIIRLGLCEGDVFYDIGGGTGSVAIEAASLSDTLKVFTIEKKSEAAELIRENISKAGLFNVTVIEDEAEKALCDMPRPDCVFIGGSGGKLSEIVDILHSKGDGIRFVVNAVSLETIDEIREIIRKYEADEEAIMLSVSDVRKVGSHHMLAGQNPIWIFSFTV